MTDKKKHVCKFTKTCKTLDLLYPPHSKFSKIRRRFREFFLISEENGRKCFTPMGTTGYIAEKDKQLNQHIFTIHPYSKFRECWEIIAIIEICLGFFIRLFVTSQCSKNIWSTFAYQVPAFFSDIFETVDVFLLFFVGFIDKETGSVVFNFRKIFFHRILNLYFVVNVIVSLPLEFFSYLFSRFLMNNLFHPLLKNVAFIKILKLHVCTKYLTHVAKIHNWSELSTILIWGIFCNLFVCHWLTCAYHQIFLYKRIKGSNFPQLIEVSVDSDDGFLYRYTKILYTISCILLNKNVVLREISDYTMEDNFFWFFAIITLYFCSIVTFGLDIQYLALLRNSGVFYEEMKQEVQKFLIQENLPKEIHKKVMKYLQFRFRNAYFVEELILKALSPPLKREVANFLCMDLLINPKSIFVGLPKDMATELCLLMTYEVFLPGDVFFRAGDKPLKMYFLYSGSVAVYSERGKEVMHWYEGQQFGVSSFMPNVLHPVTIIALEMSECYVLRYKDFLKTTAESPEYVKIIGKAASDRRHYVLGLYSED